MAADSHKSRRYRKQGLELTRNREKVPVMKEKHQEEYAERSLQPWAMERLSQMLARYKDDTLGMLVMIEEIFCRAALGSKGGKPSPWATAMPMSPHTAGKHEQGGYQGQFWFPLETRLLAKADAEAVRQLQLARKTVCQSEAHTTFAGGHMGGLLTLGGARHSLPKCGKLGRLAPRAYPWAAAVQEIKVPGSCIHTHTRA